MARLNDVKLTEALISIPRLNTRISAAVRNGHIASAVDDAGELVAQVRALADRLSEIAETLREPMGS